MQKSDSLRERSGRRKKKKLRKLPHGSLFVFVAGARTSRPKRRARCRDKSRSTGKQSPTTRPALPRQRLSLRTLLLARRAASTARPEKTTKKRKGKKKGTVCLNQLLSSSLRC